MRTLKRNQQSFHYFLYREKIDEIDGDGNLTGEKILVYDAPVECKGHISAGQGEKQVELFGTNVSYEKVILLDDMSCPIDENSVLCIDVQPEPYEANKTPNHDYIVTAVAKSLNVFAVAIKKKT